MKVTLGQDLRAHIFRVLETTYPNEGGGFLLGKRDNGSVIITDTIAIDNVFEVEEQYHRYAMTPHDWARLEDEADSRGLTLVGYFHSHPDSAAIPSEYDREYALPNFTYLITQVNHGRAVDLRAWLLRDDRSAFDALELVIT